MKPRQLRSYIPIAAPARREPADGHESALRVVLGFEPAWFHRRCRVGFGERWHRDPAYRRQTLLDMKHELRRAFPEAVQWRGTGDGECATISGVYGAYPIAHAFGVPLIYSEDRWPVLDPTRKLTLAQMESVSADRVLQSAAVEDIYRQMDEIERTWGPVDGYLNWQGVLNNAFNVRGERIFLDMVDAPDAARAFFGVITDVMIGLAREVQSRQRRSGYAVDQLGVSNCVMNMISPETYAESVRPFDRLIAQSFERFGVHTCNWNVTPYIDAISELPNVGYLDMGIESDMRRVRERFPHARRAVLYSPVTLHSATVEQIRGDMRRIYDELSPCDVVMADIRADTPDERVRALLDMCAEIEASAEETT